MDEKLKSLIELYKKTEKEIDEELDKLPMRGNICKCDEPNVFRQIYVGHWHEMMEVCLECGGDIEG